MLLRRHYNILHRIGGVGGGGAGAVEQSVNSL